MFLFPKFCNNFLVPAFSYEKQRLFSNKVLFSVLNKKSKTKKLNIKNKKTKKREPKRGMLSKRPLVFKF